MCLFRSFLGDIAEAKSPDYLDPEALGIPILTAASMARAPLLGKTMKENYAEETVPRESEYMFRAHFRIYRTFFEVLLDFLCKYDYFFLNCTEKAQPVAPSSFYDRSNDLHRPNHGAAVGMYMIIRP